MPDDRVYLTFDDGPDEQITPALLALLREHDLSATFFVVGEKVERHPEVVRQLFEAGHVIGNHSYHHPRLLGKNKDFIRAEVLNTDAVIAKIIGKIPILFRPPYGRFGSDLLSVLNDTGHKMILWSASTKDYKSDATPVTIANTLLKQTKPGKIILLHDGHANSTATLDALRSALGDLIARGMKFAAIPES
jgi:peptidoglycan/xylan/chitin deacetylase (PgdA/CDA1 family)